jgi:HAD superfamily hydrolase (TIGR01509 family)
VTPASSSAAPPPPEFAARVRGILFDAGNTLLWIDHARVARIVTAAGLPVTTEQVREAEMRARPLLDPLLGHVPKREAPHVYRTHIECTLEHLLPAGRKSVDPAVFSRAANGVADAWGTLWVCPPDDAHDTLRTLRERGYPVACVSNSNGKVDRLLVEAGLDTLLDDVVDSGALGIEKPDPRIFAIAAERAGLSPDEMVYVGDLHALDVVGPERAGMHAILLDPIGAFDAFSATTIRALSDLLPWFPGPPPSPSRDGAGPNF